jgi:hypothetical protein
LWNIMRMKLALNTKDSFDTLLKRVRVKQQWTKHYAEPKKVSSFDDYTQ